MINHIDEQLRDDFIGASNITKKISRKKHRAIIKNRSHDLMVLSELKRFKASNR